MKINICFPGIEPGGRDTQMILTPMGKSAKGGTWPERDREDFTNKVTFEMDPGR